MDFSSSPQERLNQCGTPAATPNPARANAIQCDHGEIATAAITHKVANLRHGLVEFLSEAITAFIRSAENRHRFEKYLAAIFSARSGGRGAIKALGRG
ncbi:MAG: hypothetical protein P4L55_01215 [Syntrophobacteraceae bacterium]|nr:hypothetical protein [Syntrophobacteraceae bacterium]